jgi:hypothetical protein
MTAVQQEPQQVRRARLAREHHLSLDRVAREEGFVGARSQFYLRVIVPRR